MNNIMGKSLKWGVLMMLLSIFVMACEPETPEDVKDPNNTEQPGNNNENGGENEGEENGGDDGGENKEENEGDQEEPEQEANYFNITVSDVTPTSAFISVTPTADLKYKWYWDVDLADRTFDEDYVYKYIDDLYATALETFGYSEDEYPYEDFCNDMFIPAEYTDEWTYPGLTPETEYTVWVCALDDYGQVKSDIKTYTFKTAAVKQSSMTFSIDIDDDMNLTIIPSNPDETYMYYFGGPDSYKEDGFESIEDCLDQMAKYILSMGSDLLYKGSWTENMKGYLDDGTNYVWIVGYDGGFTTEVFEFPFEYEYIPPGNNTMTEDVTGIEYIRGSGYNLGDYKGTYEGLDYYEFYIYAKQESEDRGDCHTMKLYLFTEPGLENISGEYELSDTPQAGKAFKGYINDEGYLAGCHYFHSSQYTPYALLTEGTIYVHQGEDNMMSIAVEAKSDDFEVGGIFNGELVIEKVKL